MTKNIIHIILKSLSGLSCLVIAGCAGSSHYMDGDSHKRNEVQMVRIPHVITFGPTAHELSATEVARLDRFMMTSHVSYGDELSMDFPLTRDGQLTEQDQERLTALTALLKKRGLHLAPNVTPYGSSPGKHQARLLVSRYVVTPPHCGDWSQPSTDNFNNAPLKTFGCASQAQLGLMVANPRDLVVGNANNHPNAEQAARGVKGYLTKPATTTTATSTKK
ncbi:CpaD family pilus assembly lipoprotein [Paremcibacter congregatus]|uniref:Pilus assembly protein CpaD n=1 Tax=Paremcibacter congregatus TaxID=2043170 RepID=A0A2G4YRC2_9PROT|nr:CpaD family pilus assembly lipoprotein [Paremcibacter congregatus]PHZ84873.1 hypothetical protein CRD36_09100 [Paremcibacter congregatus]QDE26153.1 hypothetical protein FIV45_02045 [Paremcibacter congregatus]